MENQVELFLDDGTVLVQIPMFSNYYADLDNGVIYSTRRGKGLERIKGYERPLPHNYVTTTLIRDDGKSVPGLLIHELITAAKEQSWDWKYIFGFEINHINEVKNQNFADNLELVKHVEQYTQSIRDKISQSKQGSKHHLAKLNEDDVYDIRERYRTELEGRKTDWLNMIAEEYGVSASCINSIINGFTWQHLI